MSPSENESREAKRARQACLNCRRKKTRCSGERPACSICTRLHQDCHYGGSTRPAQLSGLGVEDYTEMRHGKDTDLAARVARLESRLGMADSGNSAAATIGSGRDAQDASHQGAEGSSSPSGPSPNSLPGDSKFTVVPDLAVLLAAADVYFANCQNQPYCHFHESSFRLRLEAGTLPSFLILSFMATSARYSSDPFFEGLQFQAIDAYARTAWLDILNQAFSSEHGTGMNISMVQATSMLAVIDFTAGRNRLGWVKIGMSVRFAQGLRLNVEPDPTLPVWQQEEHRRVFWSVYVLDKLVSCSRNHSPTILDVDCSLRLPASEENFRSEIFEDVPTLDILHKLPDITQCLKLDDFALTVLAASFLGRVLRYTLQQSSYVSYPPWDSRSDYAKMSSMLLSFECILTTKDDDYLSALESRFRLMSGIDRQRAGHFIWSRGLYQLCNCFLTHPFLMNRTLSSYRLTYPRSYLREASRRSQDSAGQLSAILRAVNETGCCAKGSFLGYLAVAAGTVHHVYTHSKNEFERVIATELRDACLEFLDDQPLQWEHYPRMAKALRTFEIEPLSAQALIEPSPTADADEVLDPEKFWCLLDYGWLCDGSRSDAPPRANPFLVTPSMTWGYLDEITGEDSFFQGWQGLHAVSSLQPAGIRNGRSATLWDSRTSVQPGQRRENRP